MHRLSRLWIIVGIALTIFAVGCGSSEDNSNDTQSDVSNGKDVNNLLFDVGNDDTTSADVNAADTTPSLDGTASSDASAKPFTVAESNVPRETNPSTSKLDSLVSDNNTFAFKLYRELSSEPGNLFYSPYSISLALAMTYAGAKGETAKEMASALEFNLSGEALDSSFNALSLELVKRGEGKRGADGGKFRINVVNQLWGREKYTFLSSFLDLLSKHYGAGLKLLDFAGDPEGSRGVINNWVAEQTEQRIKDLLPKGSVTSDTALVLTNAIYFNAAWAFPFEESRTKEAEFTRGDNSTVKVDFMEQTEDLKYHKGSGYQVVRMPYDGHELEMVVILPDAGTFASFEAGFNAAKLEEMIAATTTHKTTLKMPKFEYTISTSLLQPLRKLGMELAFSGMADFSGINGTGGLQITGVLHKAFVKVNEKGTEAAAATAVVVGITSLPPEYPAASITLDRPFIFVIRDRTKATLFVGRIADPTAK